MDAYTLVVSLFVFVVGSAIGSFLNVVIYRIPAKLSILYPPSRCPSCGTRLGKRENVPIVGWLWLRGKCRHCRSAIAPRYPLVELFTGLVFVGVYLQFGLTVEAIATATFLSWLIALALIDYDTLTLPNSLTQSGLVLGLGFMLIQGIDSDGTAGAGLHQLMTGVTGMVVGLWLLDAIAFIGSVLMGRTAMGAGDAKLMAMIGAWLGWPGVLMTTFLGCLLGAVIGGGAIAFGWRDRRQPMPFGPFLALGAGINIFWGALLLKTYLDLFVPVL